MSAAPSSSSAASAVALQLRSISRTERFAIATILTILVLIFVSIVSAVIVYRQRIAGMIQTVSEIQNQYQELQPTIDEAQTMIGQLNSMNIVTRANCVLADTECALSMFKDPESCGTAVLPPCKSATTAAALASGRPPAPSSSAAAAAAAAARLTAPQRMMDESHAFPTVRHGSRSSRSATNTAWSAGSADYGNAAAADDDYGARPNLWNQRRGHWDEDAYY